MVCDLQQIDKHKIKHIENYIFDFLNSQDYYKFYAIKKLIEVSVENHYSQNFNYKKTYGQL